jgi:hypothetical protein
LFLIFQALGVRERKLVDLGAGDGKVLASAMRCYARSVVGYELPSNSAHKYIYDAVLRRIFPNPIQYNHIKPMAQWMAKDIDKVFFPCDPETKNFCAENPESRYDSIKFFKNDFKLVFKNKKIEDGEWNLRKKPNESKGYLVFNPNLKNTDEIIFTIKQNDLSEIINVIINNDSFILCSNKSFDSKDIKDTISTNVEKIAELNLTEKIIKEVIVEDGVVNRINQSPDFTKNLNEITNEKSNAGMASNSVIVNKKDINKSDNNTEFKNNNLPEILYYNVIQIAAFLDLMNAEKYYTRAKILGYNVKINLKLGIIYYFRI